MEYVTVYSQDPGWRFANGVGVLVWFLRLWIYNWNYMCLAFGKIRAFRTLTFWKMDFFGLGWNFRPPRNVISRAR